MYIKQNNEALTIFADSNLVELKDLIELESFPILIVNNSLEMIGVLDEKHFWKTAALEGCEKPIESYLNCCFRVVRSLSEVNEEDSEKYDYFIVKENERYKCYTSSEVQKYLYEQKIAHLLKLNQSLHEQLESTREKTKNY